LLVAICFLAVDVDFKTLVDLFQWSLCFRSLPIHTGP
jgi:hypothetical protein